LLKIAAEVRVTARRIWVRYSGGVSAESFFGAAYAALSG
jgi:hypothetical protein